MEAKVVRVKDWEMRCIYNHSDLEQRLKLRQLSERIPEGNPTTARYKQEPGTITQTVFYDDPETGDEVAEFNQFMQSDGTLGASGLRDPKRFLLNGIWYRRLDGPDDVKRDVTKVIPECIPFKYIGKGYGAIRRRICSKYGVKADAKFGARIDPLLRLAFFFFDTSRLKKIFASPLRRFFSYLFGRYKKYRFFILGKPKRKNRS